MSKLAMYSLDLLSDAQLALAFELGNTELNAGSYARDKIARHFLYLAQKLHHEMDCDNVSIEHTDEQEAKALLRDASKLTQETFLTICNDIDTHARNRRRYS